VRKDEFGTFQLYIDKNKLGDDVYEKMKHLTDVGDIVGTSINVFIYDDDDDDDDCMKYVNSDD
jgi:lysyl-tRNA synthetase class II